MKLIYVYNGSKVYLDEATGIVYATIGLGHAAMMMFQRALDGERRLLDFAPCRIVPVSDDARLGQVFGAGGTNEIFMLADNPGIAVKNPGMGKSGRSSEYMSMLEMERLGMSTVVLGLRVIEGEVRLAMRRERIATDSKSVVGYQGALKGAELSLSAYIDPQRDNPGPTLALGQFVTRDLLESLLSGFDRMSAGNRCFSDFQFLITQASEVVYNDPCGYAEKTPDGSTIKIIQAFIDTWEFLFSKDRVGVSWSLFKQWKQQLRNSRLRAFGEATKGLKKTVPVFTMINPSFFRYGTPPRCVCFAVPLQVGGVIPVVANFTADGTSDDDILYWPSNYIKPRNKKDWLDIYQC